MNLPCHVSDIPEAGNTIYDDSEKTEAELRLDRIKIIRYKREMIERMQKYRVAVKKTNGPLGIEI